MLIERLSSIEKLHNCKYIYHNNYNVLTKKNYNVTDHTYENFKRVIKPLQYIITLTLAKHLKGHVYSETKLLDLNLLYKESSLPH